MQQEILVAIMDENIQRRANISYNLSRRQIRIRLFENMEELMAHWPEDCIFIVYDAPGKINSVIDEMESFRPWSPLIAYFENPTPQQVAAAILKGAVNYISWPFSTEEIIKMIIQADQNATEFGNLKVRASNAKRRISKLTSREREVLAGVATGLSARKIAEKLDISPRTVEVYRANILMKIGARHSSEAIRVAIEASVV